MKKTLALLMAVLMLLSLASAVAEYETPIEMSHVTWVADPAAIPDDPFYQHVSEKFNINFDFWTSSEHTNNDDLEVWINTGAAPDAWFRNNLDYIGYLNYVDQGLIAPIPEDWAEKYPNLYEMSAKTGLLDLMEVDGVLYTIPHTVFNNYASMDTVVTHRTYYFRKDWAEQVGFTGFEDGIGTLDELAEYITLCQENDTAGNGNTRGLVGTTSMVIGTFWWLNDINTSLPFIKGEEGYEWIGKNAAMTDMIPTLRDWYQKGLIDSDFYLVSHTDNRNVFTSGLAAALGFDGSISNLSGMYTSFEEAHPGKVGNECVGTFILADNDGVTHVTQSTNYWLFSMFNPDIAPEVLDRYLTVLDWFCTDEGQISCSLGLRGTNWDWDENGNVVILEENAGQNVFLHYGPCADDFNFINPANDPVAVAEVQRNYTLKNEGAIIPLNYEYTFHSSDNRSNYSVDFYAPVVQLMVDPNLDIDTEWQKFVEDNTAIWQPLEDELNAAYCAD